jgi:magnesium transporter
MTDSNIRDNFETSFGIDSAIRNRIIQSIENDLKTPLRKLFFELHAADQAELIATLNDDQIAFLISNVNDILNPEMLTYLSDDLKNQIIDLLGVDDSAKAINQLEPEDAVQVIENLDNSDINQILNQVSREKRSEIEEALSYPENSVGRLMNQNFIAFKQDYSVAKATQYLQNKQDLPEDFHYIVIVDNDFHPVSEVKISNILKSKKEVLMSQIMAKQGEIRPLPADIDKEEAAKLFSKYAMHYAPIVDNKGVLVGVIYADDIIDVLQEEAGEDILLLGGVNNANINNSSVNIAKSRIPWLLTSLATSAMAASIIGLFVKEIERIVALAVMMPIVASIAGNAGTQALTVLVRTIATSNIGKIGRMKILLKEIFASAINGLSLAILAAIGCYLLQNDAKLAMVFALAICSTIMVGGMFGAAIPILFDRLKFDPAVASGVFLITITDACSFLIFLGLARLIM